VATAAERPELAGVTLAAWKPTAPNRNALGGAGRRGSAHGRRGHSGPQRMGVRHGAHQNLTEPNRVLRGSTGMHTTTTTPAPALPGGRNPLRARNAAKALGIVSAVMVAAGAAIGGGKPTPSHTRPPRLRAHQPAPCTCTSTTQ
jgi:hypothetical protein